jgi:hypothetical protein
LTIWRANNDSVLDMPTNINRSGPAQYSEEEKHRVITWIMNICPVPSGNKYPMHYQYMSNKDLYLHYLAACESDPNLTVMSKGTFFLLHDLVNIRQCLLILQRHVHSATYHNATFLLMKITKRKVMKLIKSFRKKPKKNSYSSKRYNLRNFKRSESPWEKMRSYLSWILPQL